MPDKNAVVIATAGSGADIHVPATGEGHGSANMVVHEASHAIDAHAGDFNSASPAFLKARTSDLNSLSDYERQTGAGGPSETYAESAARYYGGSGGPSKTPALDAYWAANPLGGK